MTEAFTLLCHQTLSAEHQLSHQACCPTMDLAVLTAPATGTTGNPSGECHDTIDCFRLSGSTPQVWSIAVNSFFAENATCVDLVGKHLEVDPGWKFDQIDALHWSPDGQCLVAALSSRSPSRPPAFILLSVHSGQLLSFPTLITSTDSNHPWAQLDVSQPSKQPHKLNFVKWLPLPPTTSHHHQSDRSTSEPSSVGQELCDRLPANLAVPHIKNMQTIKSYMGPLYTSNPLKAPSKSVDRYPTIRFPPSLIPTQDLPKPRPKVSSLLIMCSHVNQLHFFVNGTVYLGTTALPEEVQLVAVQLLERDPPPSMPLNILHRGGVRVELVWRTLDNSIGFGTLDLLPSLLPSDPSPNKSPLHLQLFKVKPSLSVIGIKSKELNQQVQLSNDIQCLLKDCFFAYFGIVKDWHIARITGKKWYENFADLSKAHNVTAPISFQMLELLFLGQSNEGLRDYLGTKSGERTFTKWETTVTGSLTRIRLAIIELLVPALERLYILATEFRLHTYAPFSSIKIVDDHDFETLLLVESLIRYLIKSVHMLDKLVKEEEVLFGNFCKWLRSEFDYVIALENSPTPPGRPQIKYDLMAVNDFIQRGDENSLDKVIFSQFRSEAEDFKYLEETRERLSKKFYDDFLDVDGSESRAELKKRLSALLSSPQHEHLNEPNTEPSQHKSPASRAHVTPDTSHFQKPYPHTQFQTPSLAEHFKRQTEVATTPSNVPIFKPPHSSSSGSNHPLSSSFHDLPQSHHPVDPLSGHPPWGIHTSLTYCSIMISEVFGTIFSKIAMAKPVQTNVVHSNDRLMKPMDQRILSRFVEDMHYSGFLLAMEEGREVLVIDQVKPLPESPVERSEWEESQVVIDLKLPVTRIGSDDDQETAVKILDMDFFDDLEFVLLTQLDSGFNAKYFLITIDFVQLFSGHQRHSPELPVNRIHQLSSDYQPNQISLNGSQGRRTGCVTSGQGRMLHVFDMEDTSR